MLSVIHYTKVDSKLLENSFMLNNYMNYYNLKELIVKFKSLKVQSTGFYIWLVSIPLSGFS